MGRRRDEEEPEELDEEAPEAEEEEEGDEGPKQAGPEYITPAGWKKLSDEMDLLIKVERPKVVSEVTAAAELGDRSENAEYIYGKRRLRQIDSRLQFLNKRIQALRVVDPATQKGEVVVFGATVTVEDEDGKKSTYTIVGVDEVDVKAGRISYKSPLGKALLKRKAGESVVVERPAGEVELTLIKVVFR